MFRMTFKRCSRCCIVGLTAVCAVNLGESSLLKLAGLLMGFSSVFSSLFSATELEKDSNFCLFIPSQLMTKCFSFLFLERASVRDWAHCYECKNELQGSVKLPSVTLPSSFPPSSLFILTSSFQPFTFSAAITSFSLPPPSVCLNSHFDFHWHFLTPKYSELILFPSSFFSAASFVIWCNIKALQKLMYQSGSSSCPISPC